MPLFCENVLLNKKADSVRLQGLVAGSVIHSRDAASLLAYPAFVFAIHKLNGEVEFFGFPKR